MRAYLLTGSIWVTPERVRNVAYIPGFTLAVYRRRELVCIAQATRRNRNRKSWRLQCRALRGRWLWCDTWTRRNLSTWRVEQHRQYWTLPWPARGCLSASLRSHEEVESACSGGKPAYVGIFLFIFVDSGNTDSSRKPRRIRHWKQNWRTTIFVLFSSSTWEVERKKKNLEWEKLRGKKLVSFCTLTRLDGRLGACTAASLLYRASNWAAVKSFILRKLHLCSIRLVKHPFSTTLQRNYLAVMDALYRCFSATLEWVMLVVVEANPSIYFLTLPDQSQS